MEFEFKKEIHKVVGDFLAMFYFIYSMCSIQFLLSISYSRGTGGGIGGSTTIT